MDESTKTYIFFKKLHSRSLVWISLALITILLSDILPSSFVDRWYYQGLFGWIRVTYDTLLGWLPIPMLYIVISIIVVRIFILIRDRKKGILYVTSKSIGGVAFLIFVFYFMWGFNYNQISLQKRLGYNLKDVTQRDIEAEYRRATLELQNAAEELPSELRTDVSISALRISDNDLRPDVEKALNELGIPDRGRVRVRQIWPPGLLLRWSTAGMYIPQVFEGHIDKGLLSVQKPFTVAHEMAHGYGVTDEGACNFIAWLACSESNNPWVRFGGAFTYWRYAASEMPGDSIEQELKTISPVVLRSLSLIRENDKKYPDLLPKVRDAIYSNYLKHHGVEGGLKSYNYVVMMVVEYLRTKDQGRKTKDE